MNPECLLWQDLWPAETDVSGLDAFSRRLSLLRAGAVSLFVVTVTVTASSFAAAIRNHWNGHGHGEFVSLLAAAIRVAVRDNAQATGGFFKGDSQSIASHILYAEECVLTGNVLGQKVPVEHVLKQFQSNRKDW
jgi:hypothetical protein